MYYLSISGYFPDKKAYYGPFETLEEIKRLNCINEEALSDQEQEGSKVDTISKEGCTSKKDYECEVIQTE